MWRQRRRQWESAEERGDIKGALHETPIAVAANSRDKPLSESQIERERWKQRDGENREREREGEREKERQAEIWFDLIPCSVLLMTLRIIRKIEIFQMWSLHSSYFFSLFSLLLFYILYLFLFFSTSSSSLANALKELCPVIHLYTRQDACRTVSALL